MIRRPVVPASAFSIVTIVLAISFGGGAPDRLHLAFWRGGATSAVVAAEDAAAPVSLPAALTPSRSESRNIASSALTRSMPYLVYLPPGYDADSSQRYPVLYMLHGLGGVYTDWRDQGLFAAADRLILSGDVTPFIIVLPQGEQGYWVDHANNGPRWGTYVARDLVQEVDHDYRTVPSASHRAIGGMSMGGHGALQLALNYSDTFSIVGAHSVALRTYEIAFPYYGDRAYFNRHDPVSLAKAQPQTIRKLRLWIDIGESDQWEPAARAFHEQLKGDQVAHSWHTWSGGHDADYWRSHAEDYVRYYGTAFSQSAAPQ